MDFVELEFGLHRREAETYAVELRVSRPDSDAETREFSKLPVDKIDVESLRKRKLDIDIKAYGRLLAECLFADTGPIRRIPLSIIYSGALSVLIPSYLPRITTSI